MKGRSRVGGVAVIKKGRGSPLSHDLSVIALSDLSLPRHQRGYYRGYWEVKQQLITLMYFNIIVNVMSV